MGVMKHHAIIVTTVDYDRAFEKLRNEVAAIHPCVSEVVDSVMNCYASFLVAPDGSKEGWEDSHFGDDARKKVIELLDKHKKFGCEWVELTYGGNFPEDAQIEQWGTQHDD